MENASFVILLFKGYGRNLISDFGIPLTPPSPHWGEGKGEGPHLLKGGLKWICSI
jgi:hypothetical protein